MLINSLSIFQMLLDRFIDFKADTEAVGQLKVANFNNRCDNLIRAGHYDAAEIARFKDEVNERWTDLIELVDTRKQQLESSWKLHKFFHECKEVLERIEVCY